MATLVILGLAGLVAYTAGSLIWDTIASYKRQKHREAARRPRR